MNRSVHVAGICGSLNDDSRTRVTVRQALDAVEATGATSELVDLRSFDLRMFGADEVEGSEDPERLRRRVRSADAVLLGTPVYHGSYASPMKTALDYCSRDDFEDKTVGLMAVAGGGFPRPALEHLRAVTLALNARPLPDRVGVPDAGTTVGEGYIQDEAIARRVRRLGERLVEYAGVERYPELAETATAGPNPPSR